MTGLEDLYKEVILDHYRSPRNQGELPTPPAIMEEGFNPLCGDDVKVYVLVEEKIITDSKSMRLRIYATKGAFCLSYAK